MGRWPDRDDLDPFQQIMREREGVSGISTCETDLTA
jgi:hypothetical protein